MFFFIETSVPTSLYNIFIMASSSSSDKILRNNSSVVVQKITKIEGNNILILQPEGISKIELDYEKSSIAWKRFIKVLVDG